MSQLIPFMDTFQLQRKFEKELHKRGLQIKDSIKKKREWLNSQLADPSQSLRLTGTAVPIHPDGDQYYYHEKESNLMLWPGDGDTRIDRFDCRASLDFIPPDIPNAAADTDVDQDLIQFERYRDVIELKRAEVDDEAFLSHLDSVWNEKLMKKKRSSRLIDADEPPLPGDILDEDEVYQFMAIMTDDQVEALNASALDYGIRNIISKLNRAKEEADDAIAREDALEEERGQSRRKTKKKRAEGPSKRRLNRRGSSDLKGVDIEEKDESDESDSEADDGEAEFITELSVRTTELADSQPGFLDDEDDRPNPLPRSGLTPILPPAPTLAAPVKKMTALERLKERSRLALTAESRRDEVKKHIKEVQKQQESQIERDAGFSLGIYNQPIRSVPSASAVNSWHLDVTGRDRKTEENERHRSPPFRKDAGRRSLSPRSRRRSSSPRSKKRSPSPSPRRRRLSRSPSPLVSKQRSPIFEEREVRRRSPSPVRRRRSRTRSRSRSRKRSNSPNRDRKYRSTEKTKKHRHRSRSRSRSRSRERDSGRDRERNRDSIAVLRRGGAQPPVQWLHGLNSRLERIPAWKLVFGTMTLGFFMKHILLFLFLQGPEPLARMYTRSFYRATWINTALDAGFLTAMNIRPKPLRDLLSVVFSLIYLFNAEAADNKLRKYRSMATVEMMRMSWEKTDNPIIRMATWPERPSLGIRKDITIERPAKVSQSSFPNVPLPAISARVFYAGTPAQLKECEDLVFLVPGGGFVCMPPTCHDNHVSQWAKQTNRPIIAINYGKAPEFPYPWALEELFDAYKTVIETNGACLGMAGWEVESEDGSIRRRHPIRIVMAGDSAGGNLATGVILKLLDLSDPDYPPPRGVVLIYPCLSFDMACWMQPDQLRMIRAESSKSLVDLASAKNHLARESPLAVPSAPRKIDILTDKVDRTPSWYRWKADDEPKKGIHIPSALSMTSRMSYFTDRIIAPEVIRAMALLYLGTSPSPPNFQEDYYLSPVVAPEDLLAQFPQCYLICGEKDPFVDDTVVFASRLRDSKLRAQRELRRARDRNHRARAEATMAWQQAADNEQLQSMTRLNGTNGALVPRQQSPQAISPGKTQGAILTALIPSVIASNIPSGIHDEIDARLLKPINNARTWLFGGNGGKEYSEAGIDDSDDSESNSGNDNGSDILNGDHKSVMPPFIDTSLPPVSQSSNGPYTPPSFANSPAISEVPDILDEDYAKHPFSRNSNNSVRFKILAGMSHGIFQMGAILPEAAQAVRLTGRWFDEIFTDETLESTLPSDIEREMTRTVINAMQTREQPHEHNVGFYNTIPAQHGSPGNTPTSILATTRTSLNGLSNGYGHSNGHLNRRVHLAADSYNYLGSTSSNGNLSNSNGNLSNGRYPGSTSSTGLRRPPSYRNLNEVSGEEILGRRRHVLTQDLF
ncbi:hypothetical protein SmJEL517_g02130 [Synchytrium microbalum]|uniref:Suppressor of white apricot N-terminal domain-containing protein n=1 Tax=Synchytrium microbalum TaxID=1806994 RepID=A0A507C322_9FUNG|nr:uncharacterized protein SmJEL517_g02130 [Synchytrium microbalum]TPX35527.1 hypothetical protein SmJEL517_g02130 [Synchytrium microbalum]